MIKKGRKAGMKREITVLTQQQIEEARQMYLSDKHITLQMVAKAMKVSHSSLLTASSQEKALTGIGWSDLRNAHFKKLDKKLAHLKSDPEVDTSIQSKIDVMNKIDDILGAIPKQKLKEFASEIGLDQYRGLLDLKNRVASTSKIPKQTVIVIGSAPESESYKGYSTQVTVVDPDRGKNK